MAYNALSLFSLAHFWMNYGDGGEIEIIEGLVELLSSRGCQGLGLKFLFFFQIDFFEIRVTF